MKQFTLDLRKILAQLLKEQRSYREIAKVLGFAPSTISDEIKRNWEEKIYNPHRAEKKARLRIINKGKNKRGKLELSQWLKQFVVDKLEKEQWSPEQISWDLKLQAKWASILSHETIYKFIYSKEGKKLRLWKQLRHKKKAERVHWWTRKWRKKSSIPNRVSIHRRPWIINERWRFWDYEWDLVVFSNSPKTLAVFVERKTRKIFARVNENKTASEMSEAIHYLVECAGQSYLKTITFDNWTENVCHEDIRRDYNYSFNTYFCDPYSSWQKWGVENANKLLRQYLPRNLNDNEITQDVLDEAVRRINSRPRKCLGFSSSNKEFSRCSV